MEDALENQCDCEGREVLKMKRLLLPAALLVTLTARSAFDSVAWHDQREVFAREAERLRGCYSNCLAQVNSPAENVSIPVESYADGAVKTVVNAAKAQLFLQDDLVWAEDVEVKRFAHDGSVEGRIDAKNCVVDRQSKSGWAEGPAAVTQGKTSFCGEGVYFSSADGYVKVFARAQVDSQDLKLGAGRVSVGGRALAADEAAALRVQGRACDLDREAGLALFEGDVVVTYPSMGTMCADRLYLLMTGTNELSRVVAVGSVSVTNEQRVGTCSKGVYRRAKNEIEMFGDEKGEPARLVDFGSREQGALVGERIRFWLDSEQVEVDRPTVTFAAPVLENGKKGLGW